ncbi:hypothetical protein FM125_02470 [Micrococcus lylae]|uniref:Uncharacterized protein n=1 Tax=Micrococcus lylae TaxID=1273 RepID=A0A1R4IH26_9MICC|nr:hypothetical protein FM125_02470 [Micrococcus lylae]
MVCVLSPSHVPDNGGHRGRARAAPPVPAASGDARLVSRCW